MATEAYIPQFIPATKKEGEGRELSSEPLNSEFNELPQEEMQKAEHRPNKPLEIPNMGETENMQVATNINVDTANAVTQSDVGTVEDEVFIAASSVPKVSCQETSIEDEKSSASVIAVGKEMDAEVTKQSEETEEEINEKEEMLQFSTKSICISTEKEEGAKENLGGPSVAALIEETSSKKAEQDEGGKLEDNSSIQFDERSTKIAESTERAEHEEQSEKSFLTKVEPGKEKLEKSLDAASEEISDKVSVETTAVFEERGPIESFKEIIKEEKKETTYQTDDMEKERSEEKNLPQEGVNEKIEKEEDGKTEESASDSYFTDPLVNETVHLGGEKQDQDSSAEPEHGDEFKTTCANQGIQEHLQEEENKIENQASASTREEKTAESSKKDETMEEVPKQEMDEILRKADSQMIEQNGTRDIFASTVSKESKEETSFGKNEEKGPNDEVPEANEEGKETTTLTKKETDNDKECTESIEEKTIQESPQEVETREENKSAQPNVEAENQSIEEINNANVLSSTAADRNTVENVNEKEAEVMESEEEGQNSVTEPMEPIFDTTCPPEETKAKTLKDGEENDAQSTTGASREIPSEETTENRVENSSVPHVYVEEMGEEILHKAETPVTWVTEETGLKEVNPEDKMQSERFDPVSDKCVPDGANVVAKNVEATDFGENENMQIQTAAKDGAAEVGEKEVFEAHGENHDPSPTLNDEREVSTGETIQDYIAEENVKEPFAPSSTEGTRLTTEAIGITNETSENLEASYVSTCSPLAEEITEEKILQAQEKFVDPEVHACVASSDVEKASPNEEVHDDDDPQLHVTPAPSTETTISESEGVELAESITTSEASYVSTHTPLAAETTEEKMLQVQEKFIDPEVHAFMASSDVEKASANEEVPDDGQQLHVTPAPNTETTITELGVELPETIKTSEASYVSTHAPLAAETTEEKILQVQEKFMNPEVHAIRASSDVEKASPDEEVGQQLYMTPAPNTETTIIKPEGVELPESIKTSEVTDSSHIGELETSKDEKSTKLDKDKLEDENPVNDTSIEECNTSTVTKEALLSQEYSKGSSDEDAEIEKPVVEVETGGHSHEVGVSETKSTKEIAEEVPVTTEEGQDTITPVKKESESDKHCITHSIEQKTVQESAQEVQTRVDDGTAQANTETENQTAEDSATANLPSSTSVEKTIEESFKVEERDVLESTEEIKNSGMEKMEQNFDTNCTSEDTKDKTLKNAPESDTQCTTGTSTVLPKETDEDVGEKFAVPHVYEEQTGEEILHKAETTVTEENEVPKGEKFQEYTSEENLKEPHILPSRELNLTTSEATDKTDEIQEEVASYVDTHSPLAKEPTEEKQLQIEDESTGPEVRTYMASENEIVHKEDQQLHVTPALDTETRFAESEDVELPKSIKASEVADSTNTGNTEISKDEKWLNTESEKDKVEDPRPVNDGSNEACDASTQIEKTVIEEEHSPRNFRNSLKEDVNIEKEVGEVEAGGHIQETGVHERKSTSTVKEEVPETTKEGPEMEMTDIQQNDSGKDWTTESIEEKTVQESFPKTEEIEKNKSTPANMETEDENKERTTEASLYSPTIAEKSIEESLEEEEKDGTESKEEVKHSDRELLEQNFDTRCPTEDTNVETLKDGAKPNQDSNTQSTTDTSKVTPAKEPNADLVENTSVPCVFEKETGEEILHKSDTIVAGVTEEAVLKELNEEDKMRSDSFDLVSDDSPTTADSFEITPKINDERDVSTGEMLLDFISEQNPKEPYATSSIEHALLTSEATETTDVTPEKAGASYVSPHSPFGAETTEETTLQIQDMSTNPEVQADISSADMEKDGANEEVNDKDQQPHVIPALNTDASITESGHVELLKISKTSELAECSKVGEVENSKDEKWLNAEPEKDKLEDPVNETSNEACNTSTEIEKASQEQEHSARNVKSNPKEDVEIEKEAVELEAGDHVQDSEVSKTNCTSTVTEEDPESIETREQPRSDSQSVTGDQSDKVTPLLYDVDIPAKLPQVSVLGENKNMEIPTAAKEEEAESEEKTDHEVQKETYDTSSKCEEEREVSAADTPPVYTAEQNIEDSSTVSSEEHNHVTTEASEEADGPQEKVEASSINTYTPSVADTIEDKLSQKQVEPTDPRDEAHLASIDTENSSANEEVHDDQEMYKARALNTEKNVTESQEVELQKSTETSDVTSGSDIAKWETLQVQKSLNGELDEEAEKTVTDAFNEAHNTSIEPETEVLEQIKDPDLVPTENPEVTNYSENKETAKSQAAESGAENQNIKTCFETNNANIEECSKSVKDLDLESVGQQVTESGHVELLKISKTSEVAECSKVGEVENSKDEKWLNAEPEKDKLEDPVNETSNEACNMSTEIEKASQEQEHSARNVKSNPKEDVEIEKEAVELEVGDHVQDSEVSKTNCTSTVTEEDPESIETREQPRSDSQSVTGDQSDKVIPLLDDVDIPAKLPQVSVMGENKNMEIPTAAKEEEAESEEKTDHEVQKETCDTSSKCEEEREVSTADTPSVYTAEQNIEDSSTVSSEEHIHVTTEASEEADGPREKVEASSITTYTPSIADTIEDKLSQKQVEPTDPRDEAHLASIDTENSSANEEVHDDQEMYKARALNTEKNVTESQEVELQKSTETSDVTSGSDIAKWETLQVQKSLNDELDEEAEKTVTDAFNEAHNTSIEPETEVLEQIKDPDLVPTENPEVTNYSENKETAKSQAAESGAENQNIKTCFETNNANIEECSKSVKDLDLESVGQQVTESGHVELLKISKTSEVAECSKVGEVENSKDEKWLNAEPEKDKLEDPVTETSNEACNMSTEIEKASQEQEHSARNVKSNPKEDVEIEKEAVEVEVGDHVQDSEVSETNCTSTVTEEDPESIETREQPRSDSQSVTGDQSDKVIPLLDDVDIPAKLPQISVMGENKNMEIPTAAKEEEAESEEKTDNEVQKETCDTSSKCEEEREVSAADTPSVYTAEQNIEDSSTVSSEEHIHVTTEASEEADGPREKVEASSITTYTPSIADTIEDKLSQKQVEPTDPRDEAHLASIDTENSSANEEVHDDQEMYKARALNTEKNVTESQEVELQKSTETSDVTSGSDIAKWETLQVQKSLNDELDEEAEKTVTDAFNEAYNTSIEPETEVLEQIKDPDLVPTENPEVTNYSENKETAKSQATESEAENQNIKTCSETNNANIEECSKSFKDLDLESVGQQVIGDDCQEGQREIYEDTEPKFEATNQSKETLVGIEPIKNVTLNEEVPKAVEKAKESETINRQTVEEDNCRTEIETTVAPNEIENKITNPDQTPIENLEVTDYSETAETVKLQDAKDLSRESEEDMKKDREKPVSITGSKLELSKNIKETDIAPIALNRELVELETNEQGRCATELEAEDQSIQTLHETESEEDINSVKNMTLESTGEKIIGQDIQEGGTEMPEKMEPTLEPENQSEETQTAIERIKNVIWTEEVSGGTEKTKESEDIEVITKEESCILEHQMAVSSNEMIRDPAPRLTENLEATVSRENTETGKTLAAEDMDLKSEASSITEAPEEDTKKATEESTNITSSVSAISEDTFEEENTEETDCCNDKTNIAPLTLVTEDATSEEVQQEEKSKMDFDTTSDDKTQEVKAASTGLQGEKVDCEKLEDNSGLLSPLRAEGAVLNNESENLENKYGVEVEEPVTSDASKEKDVEDIHESHENPTADSTFEDKLEEEINEVRETISKPNHQGVNSVIAGEVLLHQILPSGSTEEETCSQNADPRELEVSNLKLELIEDPKNDSPNEAPKEECISVGEATSLESRENVSKINLVNSPSESEKRLGIEKTMHNSSKEASEEDAFNSCNSKNEAMDLPSHCSTVTEISTIEVDEKCEEPSTLDFQKNEKALQSMYGEEAAKSAETETKDEQIITATTGSKAQENQSGMTNEASETITNEIKSETATENKLAKDSPVGSPDKETVRSNYEEDVQVAVGYPGEKEIQELEATTDAIQNEKLSKELESAGLDEDDKKQVKGKDGAVEDPCPYSVGDRVVNEILQEEAEWKNVAEAPTKLDIQKTSDDTYCRDTNIGATTLSEEVTDSEFVFVKHDEGKESAINKETMTTHDVVEDALAEEAPPKVGQELEEISEGDPKEPIHETIQAYDVKKDIEEHIHSSESLKDDEKPEHTTLESTFDGRDITDDLNLKEQDISVNEARTSLPTESVQKETGDELNENKVNEEQSEIISDKQITAKIIIPQEVKCIKDEAENTKDEEEVDLSKRERTVEFDEAKIHGTINADGDVETQDQSGKFDVLSQNKDSSMEITQSNRTVDLVEPYPNENTEAKVLTGSKGVPHVQREINTQTFQESEDLKSGNPSRAKPEAKEVECGEEIIAGEERKEATEEYSSTESAKNSLADLLKRSTKGTSQVTELLIEEREPKEGKQLQDDKAETADVEEAKEDEEEEGDEHKRVDSGSDAPVMVEASSDVHEKVVAHKKSHSILSGVGSMVKHSIAKAKKVITGKSSHPKPSLPK